MSRRYKINYLKASLVLSRAERGRGRERGEAKGEGQPHCAYRTRIPFRPTGGPNEREDRRSSRANRRNANTAVVNIREGELPVSCGLIPADAKTSRRRRQRDSNFGTTGDAWTDDATAKARIQSDHRPTESATDSHSWALVE